MRGRALILVAVAVLGLASCAPERLNHGAAMPWLRVSPDGMNTLLLSHQAKQPDQGFVSGLFTGYAIAELDGGLLPWTRSHELAHAADACGSYWTALELITPPNPSPAMRNILANLRADCETADRLGGKPDALWRVLFNRYGREAVQHPEILARLGEQ